MYIQETVKLRIDTCRCNNAYRIEVRTEHADTKVKAHACAEADHTEGIEVSSEAGCFDIRYTGTFLKAADLIKLVAATPDLSTECIGIQFLVLITDTRTDHRVDLQADVEVNLHSDMDDTAWINRKIDACKVHIDNIDIFRVISEHVGVLFHKSAAEARGHIILTFLLAAFTAAA